MPADHGLIDREIAVSVESPVSKSIRVRQVSAMFDVPPSERSRLEWSGRFKLDQPWNVGLIVGPSGAGKSTLLTELFGDPLALQWRAKSVLDDFDKQHSVEKIAETCQAVGFNTIPAWLRPYKVLSNGEQFRVELARRLLESGDPIVVDEFTSVVDRQVAQIGAHAVQKYARRNERRIVVATCHYDVLDWLQPDWVFEPATMTLTGRSLQPRPRLDVTIAPLPYSAWRIFAPFHYLTATLHRSARCWGLWVNGQLASFAGVLPRPHPKARDVYGFSRIVTLPDWQGLGLAFVLSDTVASLYKGMGRRLRTYPAHPAFIKGYARSHTWALKQKPLTMRRPGRTSSIHTARRITNSNALARLNHRQAKSWKQGSRPCAVFEYVGPAADADEARRMFGYWAKVPRQRHR